MGVVELFCSLPVFLANGVGNLYIMLNEMSMVMLIAISQQGVFMESKGKFDLWISRWKNIVTLILGIAAIIGGISAFLRSEEGTSFVATIAENFAAITSRWFGDANHALVGTWRYADTATDFTITFNNDGTGHSNWGKVGNSPPREVRFTWRISEDDILVTATSYDSEEIFDFFDFSIDDNILMLTSLSNHIGRNYIRE
ncbi:MAG: DUF5640 domain-containing protein [Oscillospiraceae bacterium]|nr:DUF5640 domain-containing protein [Oscillospiraceae bacterium]